MMVHLCSARVVHLHRDGRLDLKIFKLETEILNTSLIAASLPDVFRTSVSKLLKRNNGLTV